MLHQVGDLFELNVKLWCQKLTECGLPPCGCVDTVIKTQYGYMFRLNLCHIQAFDNPLILFFLNLSTALFKAYCAIWVRRSNFRHQASPRVSPRESTLRRKVELWARNVRKHCLNADLHVTFRDLLHAVKLRHGTDGFTSLPKEGVLRIFSP
jgi:hypothetical protein